MPKEIEFILKGFVRHVVNLKAEDDPAGTGFHREFRVLREEQIQNKNEDRFPTEDGRKEENLKKNRYKDILPRDDRRVKLTEVEGEKGSDYINASFIDDVNGEKGYIAAQGPMPHTLNDFWRMLWQYKAEIVFMVCKLKEEGRPKCEKYWADTGDHATYGDITVYTESEEEIQDDFYKRQLRVEREGETHTLTQFHYVGWPDHNTPSSPDVLRTMIEDVRNFRKRLDIPMVVHCSAGCGRTGTICSIDYAWTLLDRGMIKEEFSMFEIIKSMREQRMSMVQTPDQYEYTHMVMKSLCNEWLVSYSKHDYENVFIGKPPAEEEEEEEEEMYANIEFENQDGQSEEPVAEKVVSVPEAPRQEEKLVSSSQPTTDTAVVVIMTQAKKAQPTTENKTKPEEPAGKPQTGDKLPNASSPRAAIMAITDQGDGDAGEYVEVMKTATVSSAPPTSTSQKAPPPSSSEASSSRKSSRSGSETSGDSQKRTGSVSSNSGSVDPHKTVIMLNSGNATPKIIKSGSVGVSQTKQQAPKPPAQAVVMPIVVSAKQEQQQKLQQQQQKLQQQQKQQQQQQTAVVDDVKNVEVVTFKKAAERQASMSDYENIQLSKVNSSSASSENNRKSSLRKACRSMSDEDAPDLPDRNYRPEEIASLPNSPQTKDTPSSPPSSPSSPSSSSTSTTQEPIIVTTVTPANKAPPTTTTTTTTTTSSSSSTLPPSSMNQDRPRQPIPVSQGVRSGHVASAGGSVVSAAAAGAGGQSANPRSVGGPIQIVSARPAGHHHQHQHQHQQQQHQQQQQSQAVPGMVSVMVGAHTQQKQHGVPVTRIAPARVADGRPQGHVTQPILVHSHNKGPAPRQMPMMVQSAGGRGRQAVGAAPGVGGPVMVMTGGARKVIYTTDRPPRPRGPQDMPPGWSAPGKSYHRGTHL